MTVTRDDVRVVEALASVAEHAPPAMHCRHLAQPARELAERMRADDAAAWDIVRNTDFFEWEIDVRPAYVLVLVWFTGPDGERVCYAEEEGCDPARLAEVIERAAAAAAQEMAA